jgi:hypothetical protein
VVPFSFLPQNPPAPARRQAHAKAQQPMPKPSSPRQLAHQLGDRPDGRCALQQMITSNHRTRILDTVHPLECSRFAAPQYVTDTTSRVMAEAFLSLIVYKNNPLLNPSLLPPLSPSLQIIPQHPPQQIRRRTAPRMTIAIVMAVPIRTRTRILRIKALPEGICACPQHPAPIIPH